MIVSFSCRGWDTYISVLDFFGGIHEGKPDEEDLEDAREFAEQLVVD